MPDTRPRRDQHGKPNNAFSVDPRIIKEASDSLGPRINEFSTKMAHEIGAKVEEASKNP
jgi:hypothetical protein